MSLVAIRALPSPCLCPSSLPTKWCSTPVFHLRHSYVSKPHTSETTELQTHIDPLGEDSLVLWLHWLVGKDTGMTTRQFGVYSESHHIAGTKVHHPQPLFLVDGQLDGAHRVFACGQAISPLPNAFQVGEPHLPMCPWESSCAPCRGLALLPHQFTAPFPRCKPGYITNLPYL